MKSTKPNAVVISPENEKPQRLALKLSQSALARLAQVDRFRLCLWEKGDVTLKPDEQMQIVRALQAEAARLRDVAHEIELESSQVTAEQVANA